MPITKSAEKRMKQSILRRDANRSIRGGLASLRRSFFEAVTKGDKDKLSLIHI